MYLNCICLHLMKNRREDLVTSPSHFGRQVAECGFDFRLKHFPHFPCGSLQSSLHTATRGTLNMQTHLILFVASLQTYSKIQLQAPVYKPSFPASSCATLPITQYGWPEPHKLGPAAGPLCQLFPVLRMPFFLVRRIIASCFSGLSLNGSSIRKAISFYYLFKEQTLSLFYHINLMSGRILIAIPFPHVYFFAYYIFCPCQKSIFLRAMTFSLLHMCSTGIAAILQLGIIPNI